MTATAGCVLQDTVLLSGQLSRGPLRQGEHVTEGQASSQSVPGTVKRLRQTPSRSSQTGPGGHTDSRASLHRGGPGTRRNHAAPCAFYKLREFASGTGLPGFSWSCREGSHRLLRTAGPREWGLGGRTQPPSTPQNHHRGPRSGVWLAAQRF